MMRNKRRYTVSIGVFLILTNATLLGCRGTDGGQLIQQTGATALVLAAAGFEGGFEVMAEPSSRFYLMEGVGADFPGTRVSARGTMNPGAVSTEKLEKIVSLLERLSAVEAASARNGGKP